MRAVVLVGSTAVHVVVLWWIAGGSPEPRRPSAARPRAGAEETTPSAAAPLELTVVVLAEESTARAPARAKRVNAGSPAAAVAGASGSGERGDTTARPPSPSPSASPSPSPGSSLLRMRGVDLRLDPEAAEGIASAGGAGGAAPQPEVRTSGRLAHQPGGRAVVRDAVTTMDVDADGSVTFHDRPTLDVKVRAPMGAVLDPEFRREVKQHVAKWLEDPYEGRRYGATQDLPRHLQAVPGACDAWGSDWCQDPLAPAFEQRLRSIKAKLAGGISATFDVTDLVHRLQGGDPYASRKLKLLDETREERAAMGEDHRARQRARSAELMQRNLERLWAEVPDPRARRAALFALWDECDEDDAGMRARALVIGWIRARMPRGSEHAFTDEDIATLHARRTSAQPFTPYE